LAVYAPDLIGSLSDAGYGVRSTVEHVRRLAQLSWWLERERLDPAAVDERLVGDLLDVLHGSGRCLMSTPRSFRVVLGCLRSLGVAAPAQVGVLSPVGVLLAQYEHYLVVERALGAMTAKGYVATAAWFLSRTCADDPDRVAGLSVVDVSSFVSDAGRVRSPRSVNEVVVGVRSLLRYLFLKGLIDRPLAQATPWLASAKTSSLPRALTPGTAQLLLESCDRSTLAGTRDFALLSLFVRLGLRVGEVTAIELDDIDWRRGELLVRGKGGWRDTLPLPVDVGEALVAYLCVRVPVTGCRRVFLRVVAPRGPMAMTDIRAVVRRACTRVGVPDTSTHRLRHAVACELLRNGAPLYEIGQVLRHHHIDTTAIYAKVDFEALKTVAVAWPRTTS